jgi:hypothetical protein
MGVLTDSMRDFFYSPQMYGKYVEEGAAPQEVEFYSSQDFLRRFVASGRYFQYLQGEGIAAAELVQGLRKLSHDDFMRAVDVLGLYVVRDLLKDSAVYSETPGTKAVSSHVMQTFTKKVITSCESFAQEHLEGASSSVTAAMAKKLNSAVTYQGLAVEHLVQSPLPAVVQEDLTVAVVQPSVTREEGHKIVNTRSKVQLAQDQVSRFYAFAYFGWVLHVLAHCARVSENACFEVTFEKDGGDQRTLVTTFETEPVRQLYGDEVASQCSSLDEVRNSSSLFRGFVRLPSLGEFRGNGIFRSVSLARVLRARFGSSVVVDPTFVDVDSSVSYSYLLTKLAEVEADSSLDSETSSVNAQLSSLFAPSVPPASSTPHSQAVTSDDSSQGAPSGFSVGLLGDRLKSLGLLPQDFQVSLEYLRGWLVSSRDVRGTQFLKDLHLFLVANRDVFSDYDPVNVSSDSDFTTDGTDGLV